MRKDKHSAVAAFMGATAKLAETRQTFEDIYNAIMDRNPSAWASLYFDENGKPQHTTYGQTKDQVFTTASKLSALLSGTPRGSIVGLKLKNSPRWGVFFWAILMSGHAPLLIDARLAKENTNNLLRQAGAVGIVANDEEEFIVPSYRVNNVMNQEVNYGFDPDWADTCLFCSSGTTGDAKMMVFHGHNMVAQILASLSIPGRTDDLMYPSPIHILAMLPLHHIFGFVAVFLWFSYYGKTIVYPSSLATSDLLYACQKGGCTHIFSVPLFWDGVAQNVSRTIANSKPRTSDIAEKMIAYNTKKISKREAGFVAARLAKGKLQKKVLGKKVRYCISGGGFLSPKTLTLINGLGYPLYNGFGMTEVGVTSVEQSPRVESRMKGSIGRPFHGVEYKIDEKGELMVRSAIIHEEEIIGGVRRPTPLEDGFFRTGDIGAVDAQGNYYLKGRIKDTIILANGENVFPDELEYYFKDVANLHNVVCLGAKLPGESEEKIVLVCEVDNSVKDEQIEKIMADIKSINDTLPSEKKIQRILIDKRPLPMSSSMKIKRFLVKEAIEKGSSDFVGLGGTEEAKKTVSFEGYDPARVEDVLKRVTKVWSEVLMLPPFKIDPDAIWNADLGGDSMSYIEMCQLLDSEFGITIPENLYGVLGSANDFTKTILDLLPEDAPASSKKRGKK
ncbi:MAG: AMP-binding protein [Bacilli bacterium]|nr:AMP-binding protein [Bacilli bacterium]